LTKKKLLGLGPEVFFVTCSVAPPELEDAVKLKLERENVVFPEVTVQVGGESGKVTASDAEGRSGERHGQRQS